jgi:hypothetical protein
VKDTSILKKHVYFNKMFPPTSCRAALLVSYIFAMGPWLAQLSAPVKSPVSEYIENTGIVLKALSFVYVKQINCG